MSTEPATKLNDDKTYQYLSTWVARQSNYLGNLISDSTTPTFDKLIGKNRAEKVTGGKRLIAKIILIPPIGLYNIFNIPAKTAHLLSGF